MTTTADANYWPDYSNLQAVKHALIKRYLGGYFPKLGSWARRVTYVDTHAGRGRHTTGDLGSPLVALQTLLGHRHSSELLKRCEFHFHLIERNEENFDALQSELRGLGSLPRNIVVIPHLADAFNHLSSIVDARARFGGEMEPAFVFVDPYGFKIPGALLRKLMGAGRVELFVNVIWRELAMALSQREVSPGMSAMLDLIFDGQDWRRLIGASFDEKANQAVDLLARRLQAKWSTSIRMLGDNDATRYLLVHFSNHERGRDLMKEAMWSVSPGGRFVARKSDDPSQQVLISEDPDLRPLRQVILDHLEAGPCRWADLDNVVRPTPWRDIHANDVVRELYREGLISSSDSSGRFSKKANPLLSRVEAMPSPT